MNGVRPFTAGRRRARVTAAAGIVILAVLVALFSLDPRATAPGPSRHEGDAVPDAPAPAAAIPPPDQAADVPADDGPSLPSSRPLLSRELLERRFGELSNLGTTVWGTVLDAAGRPDTRRTVLARSGEKRVTSRTDSGGRYVFRGLAPGSWEISVLGGLWSGTERLELDAGDEVRRDFRLPRPATLSVDVVDGEGRPVWCLVAAARETVDGRVWLDYRNGRVHWFDALGEGPVLVWAGGEERRVDFRAGQENRLRVEVAVEPVSGEVVDAEGRSAASVTVTAVLREPPFGTARYTEYTDADGRFAFPRLQKDRYDFAVPEGLAIRFDGR